jgi:Polyketide cyclase / dehydrase and lipid transport
MRFQLKSVEADFFDTAPTVIREAFEVGRPAGEVWDELTVENPLSWCRLLKDITWTSPRPFGVGTTRTARTIGNSNVFEEYFFRWEEGRRQSFYVVQSNGPLFRRFAEDYLVESTGDASCRFTWTIAIEPRWAARIADLVNRPLLGTLFADTRKHYRSA